MKILSMTATFGKLEHATLQLEPGLNVIHAPNEWGKSTWCAFILAMLYGVDSGERTKRNALSVKEQYKGWSGQPMSGRMEILWNDRRITLERTGKGRIPMGQFRAFETETGLPVPELTGENCGRVLLGEEASVYRRSGFIRFGDLPVAGDETFRARLNALVTTGDDNPQMHRLEESLKDLKNACRFRQSGRLPALEQEKAELEGQLSRQEKLESDLSRRQREQAQAEKTAAALENHLQTLAWEKYRQECRMLEDAHASWQRALDRAEELHRQTEALPNRDSLMNSIQSAEAWLTRRGQRAVLPPKPEVPQPPKCFAGMTPEEAVQNAERDEKAYRKACKKGWLAPVLLGIALIAATGAGKFLPEIPAWSIPAAVSAGAVLAAAGTVWGILRRGAKSRLLARYSKLPPEAWRSGAADYAAREREYQQALTRWSRTCQTLSGEEAALREEKTALFGAEKPEEVLRKYRQGVLLWDTVGEAEREAEGAYRHYQTIKAMSSPVDPPKEPDTLRCTGEEARQQLADARQSAENARAAAQRIRGVLESLPPRRDIQAALAENGEKIQKTQEILDACLLALTSLEQAKRDLQSRFAPRISAAAREYLARMTGGRYDRLALEEDLSLRTGAEREDTLHSLLWRSGGTADQTYIALRLAVAKELMPDSPLILDDALVRCDDVRMGRILDILTELAQTRQVLVFTCQEREGAYLEGRKTQTGKPV